MFKIGSGIVSLYDVEETANLGLFEKA